MPSATTAAARHGGLRLASGAALLHVGSDAADTPSLKSRQHKSYSYQLFF